MSHAFLLAMTHIDSLDYMCSLFLAQQNKTTKATEKHQQSSSLII